MVRAFRWVAAALIALGITGVAPLSARASGLPPAGMVSWWPGDGDASDVAGVNAGKAHSGVTYQPGVVGQAFVFNGKFAGLNVPDADAFKLTGSLSITAWVSVAAFPQRGRAGIIFFRGDDRGALDPYALSTQADGTIQFHVESLTTGVNLYAPIPTGRFVHVAGTFDDSTGLMRVYLDGDPAGELQTRVRPFRDLLKSWNPSCGIGNHGGYPTTPHNHPFNGLVDELQIYGRPLSPSEVRGMMLAGLAGKRAAAIEIDVLTASPKKVIDLSAGLIPVALLSTATFDAPGQVEPTSLTFGRTGNEQSIELAQTVVRDVNNDGLPDLLCQFRPRAAGFTPTDVEAIFRARTINGAVLIGAQRVAVL